jgi:segregation and condensation protein B
LSLKAKIEAVIYASEEPVTLAQLVGLLGQEGQAELDRLEDRQGSLGLDGDEDAPAEGVAVEATLEAVTAVELRSIPHPFDEAERMGHPEQATASAEASATAEADSSAALRNDNQVGQATATTEADSSAALRNDNQVGQATATTEADSSAALRNDHQDGADDHQEKAHDHQDGAELTSEAVEATSESPEVGQPVSEAAEKKAAKEKERKLREFFREILDELMKDYATGDRGLEVKEVAGGFRMATKPEYHDAVRGFVRGLKPVLKLSLQALETLAVVAYKQPVTAPEVSEIRGVDSGGVLGSLMGRKLITTAGRKQVIGRPILYKTTKDFLLRFGLKDIGELPSIEEFEKLAGEMAEQEEIPMADANEAAVVAANVEEEKEAVEPQADGDSGELDEVMPVDGRISGLDPDYDKPGNDPSADEAAIQEDEKGSE